VRGRRGGGLQRGSGGGWGGDKRHDGVVITCRQCIGSGCAYHAFVVARIQMIFRKLAARGGGWPSCGSLVLCCAVLCCVCVFSVHAHAHNHVCAVLCAGTGEVGNVGNATRAFFHCN
jgi:hypothetical protein